MDSPTSEWSFVPPLSEDSTMVCSPASSVPSHGSLASLPKHLPENLPEKSGPKLVLQIVHNHHYYVEAAAKHCQTCSCKAEPKASESKDDNSRKREGDETKNGPILKRLRRLTTMSFGGLNM